MTLSFSVLSVLLFLSIAQYYKVDYKKAEYLDFTNIEVSILHARYQWYFEECYNGIFSLDVHSFHFCFKIDCHLSL